MNFGYGRVLGERSRDARQGHPMAGWKIKGVKSRLNVVTVTEQTQNRNIETNLAEFADLAGGTVGTYGYTRDRPVRPVVIHATHDKAHTMNGYLRYTPDGHAHFGDARRGHSDLQGRSLGQCRFARTGDASRSIEFEGVALTR